MSVLLSAVAIVLTLLVVIGIHEAGHAVAARLFHVRIQRISIGFGRPLFRFKSNRQIEWVWSLLPLGGYVHLLNSRIHAVQPEHLLNCFDQQAIWKRVVILMAGALANLLVGWAAFSMISGMGYQQLPPVISAVRASSIAAESGLKSGDRIVAIGGQETPSWREVGMQLMMKLGKQAVTVTLDHESGAARQATLDLKQWQTQSQGQDLLATLGIEPDPAVFPKQVEGLSALPAMLSAFWQVMDLIWFFLILLKQLVFGVIPFSLLLGPIGFFSEMMGSFFQGMVIYLYFVASLSLAVALINLFPIPGLDGGSILYAIIEKIRGKPISIALEVLLHRLAFILFCVMLIQLLLNDLGRVI